MYDRISTRLWINCRKDFSNVDVNDVPINRLLAQWVIVRGRMCAMVEKRLPDFTMQVQNIRQMLLTAIPFQEHIPH